MDPSKEGPKQSYAKALTGGKAKDKPHSSKDEQNEVQANQAFAFKPLDDNAKDPCSDTGSEITSPDFTDEDSVSTDKDKGERSKGERAEGKGRKGDKMDKKYNASSKSRHGVASPVELSSRRASSSVSPPTVSSEASEGDRSSKSPLTFRRRIPFFSGNPVVDITKGIVHLFKEK